MADIIQCVGNRQIHVTKNAEQYELAIILARPGREPGRLATLILEPAEAEKLHAGLPAAANPVRKRAKKPAAKKRTTKKPTAKRR